jgi:hypothetical protein
MKQKFGFFYNSTAMVLLSYRLLTVYLTIKRSDYDGSTIRERENMIHRIFFCFF